MPDVITFDQARRIASGPPEQLGYDRRVLDVVRFGRATVVVDPIDHRIETHFYDGSALVHDLAPSLDADMAERLGYGAGGLWDARRDHVFVHHWLAWVDGLCWSWALWQQAHPGPEHRMILDDEVAAEEARVLEYQRAMSKNTLRPWERTIEREHWADWNGTPVV